MAIACKKKIHQIVIFAAPIYPLSFQFLGAHFSCLNALINFQGREKHQLLGNAIKMGEMMVLI